MRTQGCQAAVRPFFRRGAPLKFAGAFAAALIASLPAPGVNLQTIAELLLISSAFGHESELESNGPHITIPLGNS